MSRRDPSLTTILLRLLDPLLIAGSLYLLTVLYGDRFDEFDAALAVTTFFVASYLFDKIGLHRHGHGKKMAGYVFELCFGWCATVGVLSFLGLASGLAVHYSQSVMLTWWIVAPLSMLHCQLILRMVGTSLYDGRKPRSVVIVGANRNAAQLVARIEANPEMSMRVQGCFEDRGDYRRFVLGELPLLGKMCDLAPYVRSHKTDIIFISQPISSQPRMRELLDELLDTTASLYFIPDIAGSHLLQARFDQVAGVPVVAVCETPFIGLNRIVKRGTDIALALLIQIAIAPLMLGVAIAIKLTSHGPVIFKQRRYGLNGDEIVVYKFRSMHVCEDGDHIEQVQKNDPRVTRLGAFLRRTSLDELPQFFNVLQGRMSIVGPRPHAVAHNELYRKLIRGYMLRHKVRPGITGWAQVNGFRGETDTVEKMEARIALDLEYLRKWSLPLDLWVILRTLVVIWKKENAH